MKILYRLILLMLALSVGACGDIPAKAYYSAKREAAKTRPAYKKFQELCNSKDRVVVYDTKKVDGYLFAHTKGTSCRGDWYPIYEWGYKYNECSTAKFSNYNSILSDDLYHFYIGDKNEDACVEPTHLTRKEKKKVFNVLKADQCLAKKKVGIPVSDYAKVLEWGYLDFEGNHVLGKVSENIEKDFISFYGYSVIEIETGRVLAVVNRKYNYFPEPGNKVIGGFSCDENRNINFYKNVLIPN